MCRCLNYFLAVETTYIMWQRGWSSLGYLRGSFMRSEWHPGTPRRPVPIPSRGGDVGLICTIDYHLLLYHIIYHTSNKTHGRT